MLTLKVFRLVVLFGIVALNWVLIALFFSLFHSDPDTAALKALLVEGLLIALALSPLGELYWRVANRLRRPLPAEENVLRPAMERVAARCGLDRVPEVLVQHDPYPNGLAVGTNTVAVTTGLLQHASQEEIEAVLAHEVGHLQNGDTKIRLVAYVANAAGNVALWALTGIMLVLSAVGFGGMVGSRETIGFGWIILLLAWMIKASIWVLNKILELSHLAVGRWEEYAADEFAARHGYRDGLIAHLSRPGSRPGGLVAALYATHPPSEARINRLLRN
jgi:Zn-dependent protease with chaperone function